jgi:hypothetical protein
MGIRRRRKSLGELKAGYLAETYYETAKGFDGISTCLLDVTCTLPKRGRDLGCPHWVAARSGLVHGRTVKLFTASQLPDSLHLQHIFDVFLATGFPVHLLAFFLQDRKKIGHCNSITKDSSVVPGVKSMWLTWKASTCGTKD